MGLQKMGSYSSTRVPGGSQLAGKLCVVTVVLLAEAPCHRP